MQLRSRKNKVLTVILSIFLISIIGLYDIDDDENFANAQTDVKVPEWIKTLAKYWSENRISDSEFVSAIEFLVKDSIITSEKIIIIENNTIEDNASQEPTIPDWIRNNALWFSDGTITERDFVSGIEFMIEEEIIQSSRIQIIDEVPIADSDNDGFNDDVDDCPNLPEMVNGFEDNDGCPDEVPIADSDNDGFNDDVDDCPNLPEMVNGFEDNDGCPDEVPIADSDNDGFNDDVDDCPNLPEMVNGFEDNDGCPDEVPIADSDNDGFNDDVDDCPNLPETINGFEDEDGCPDEVPIADSDNDGFNDDVDDCPNLPETINGFEDEDGCPDELIVTNNDSNNGLADKSLTISNVEISPPANSGWGDPRITLSWTYFVDHVDESNAGFPTEGHFVIEIVGVKTVRSEANYVSDNIFFGEFDKIDPGAEGGPVTITIISFEGDDRGVYVGDGDQQEIIIPPYDPEE